MIKQKTTELLRIPTFFEYLIELEEDHEGWEELPADHPGIIRLQVLAKLAGLWDSGDWKKEESHFLGKYRVSFYPKEIRSILGKSQSSLTKRLTVLRRKGEVCDRVIPDDEMPRIVTPILRYDCYGNLDTYMTAELCAKETGFTVDEIASYLDGHVFSPNGDIFRRFGNVYILNRKRKRRKK